MTTEEIERIKGDVYRIAGDAPRGTGLILEPWEKGVTFEEFRDRQDAHYWLTARPGHFDYYFLEGDIIQEGSMSAPEIMGVFVPKGVDKKVVADGLRRLWGPATKLMKR